MATRQQFEQFQRFVDQLPDKREFVTRFNSIKDPIEKQGVMDNILAQSPKVEPQSRASQTISAGIRTVVSPLLQNPLSAGVGRGAKAVEQGATVRDLPFIAQQTASGATQGLLESVQRRPLTAAIGGPSLAQLSAFREPEKRQLPSFKPDTEAGRKIGRELEFAAGFADLGVAGAITAKQIGKASKAKAIQRARVTQKPQALETLGKLAKKEPVKAIEETARRKRVIGKLQKIQKERGFKSQEQITQEFNKQIDTLGESVRKETQQLGEELSSSSRSSALEAQKKLPKFFKKKSTEYGEALDAIFDVPHPDIKRQDIFIALDNTLKDAGLRGGVVVREANTPVEKAIVKLGDDFLQGLQENFSIKSLIELRKSVRRLVPTAQREGTKAFTADEHIVSLFNENIGAVLDEVIPELKVLNANYSPFIQLKKKAVQTFKPFAGELETGAGEAFLKRASTGKGARIKSERGLLDKIKQQSGIDLSKETDKIGKALGTVKEKGVILKKVLEEAKELALGKAETDSQTVLNALKRRVTLLERNIDNLNKSSAEKVTGLANKKKVAQRELDKLLKKEKPLTDAVKIIKRVAGTVAILGGTSVVAGALVGRQISRSRT